MESEIARDVRGRPVPERFARRFFILQTLAIKGELNSGVLHESIGIDTVELSELLTTMLRNGEIRPLNTKGEAKIGPTTKGINAYVAILESLYPSPDSS